MTLSFQSRFLVLAALIVFLLAPSTLWAQDSNQQAAEFSDQQLEDFENKIRPLLVRHCYECHGPDADPPQGGLSLATRASALAGGDTGPAIVPGDPKASLLVDAINYGEYYAMPPSTKLPQEEIDVITNWVKSGAAWPRAEHGEDASRVKEFNLAERRDSHWCWQPLSPTAPPDVQDSAWVQDSLDRFILKRLEDANIRPASPADRRTLIRRAYFDLIGLPPSPQQVQDFVDDSSPEAFEKVIDELLESPRFGERWARHWLDLARYAESYGHQYDYNMAHAYQYRDYLIRAFNEDVPYKQLIQEHIAGDLLDEPRRHVTEDYNESILATAFWYLGQAKPSAVDSRANEADMIDDRIDTMSKTFLGLTVACARCHDHKFDAISTADYYSLAGFFQSSRRQLSMLDPGRKIEESFNTASQLADEGDELVAELTERIIEQADSTALSAYLHAAINVLRTTEDAAAIDDAIDRLAKEQSLDCETLARLIKVLSSEDVQARHHPLHVIHLAIEAKNGVDIAFANEIASEARNAVQREQTWLENSKLFADFSAGLPEGWFRTGFAFGTDESANGYGIDDHEAVASATGPVGHSGAIDSGRYGQEFYGVIRSPTFRLDDPRISYRLRGRNATIRLIIDSFFMDEHRDLLYAGARFQIEPSVAFGWQSQARDIKNHLGAMAHIEIIDHGYGSVAVDEIRFSAAAPQKQSGVFDNELTDPKRFSDQASLCELVAASLVDELEDSSSAVSSDLANWLCQDELLGMLIPRESAASCAGEGEVTRVVAQLKAWQTTIKQAAAKTPRPMLAIGITDGTGEDERVFIRGNHKTLGELAPRGFLSALAEKPFDLPTGSGRLQLAAAMTADDNPLTARVAVNRVWHHLFGRGLVASVDNFGALGAAPTHPELLDHLATDFMANGSSIKQMIRKIALSRTYQMSSTVDGDADLLDPNNELWHRTLVRRLQGEAIRDSILQVSGELNTKMFGPPVSAHLTAFMTGRGRPRKSGPVDGEGRRTIYLAVRRNFMSPMMLAFDTPVPLHTTGRRNISNVPAQALIMMNSPFVNQQAQAWAKRLTQTPGTVAERVEQIYLESLGRPPLPAEVEKAEEFISSLAKDLKVDEAEISNSVEIWEQYCHLVFNLKEFVFLY